MRRDFLLALVVGVGLTAAEGCKPDVTAGPKPLMHHLKTQTLRFQQDTSETYVAMDGGSVQGSFPIWTGETVDPAPDQAYCPASYPRPEFTVILVDNGERVLFRSFTTAFYMNDVPSPEPPFRAAQYRFPEFVHSYGQSEAYGKLEAIGGTLQAVCKVVRLQIGNTTVETGLMKPFRFDGRVAISDDTTGGGGGGGDSRGWAYSDETGFQNGEGSGSWFEALDRYLRTGVCTAGWEVWVNGRQVCDGF